MFWRNEPVWIDRRQRGRLETLFAADLSLAAYHLALDAHPELGNNALLAEALGVEVERPFAEVGQGGTAARAARDRGAHRPCPRDGRPRAARLRARPGSDRARRDLLGRRPAAPPDRRRPRGLRPPPHRRARGAEPADRPRARHPLRRGRSRRDRAARRPGARRQRLAEQFGLDWEFVPVENPV